MFEFRCSTSEPLLLTWYCTISRPQTLCVHYRSVLFINLKTKAQRTEAIGPRLHSSKVAEEGSESSPCDATTPWLCMEGAVPGLRVTGGEWEYIIFQKGNPGGHVEHRPVRAVWTQGGRSLLLVARTRAGLQFLLADLPPFRRPPHDHVSLISIVFGQEGEKVGFAFKHCVSPTNTRTSSLRARK